LDINNTSTLNTSSTDSDQDEVNISSSINSKSVQFSDW
jgi:hypothetical protein